MRPVFLRPLDGQCLIAREGRVLVTVEPLLAEGEGPVTLLVDGMPAGRLERGTRRSMPLPIGLHRLTATTPRGLQAEVRVRVEPDR